jgi:AraC-like DNA-binding protein
VRPLSRRSAGVGCQGIECPPVSEARVLRGSDFLAAVRRAKDSIDRDYAQRLDLDRLAGEAGYSKFHFARGFAAVYGETPRAYLTRRRIERAKHLLQSVNLTVTEICLLVGFESLGSFSACFKALVGQSPSRYRDEVVRAGGAPPIPGCFVMMWTRPGAEMRKPEEAPTSQNAIA